jgi:hypothetical protein
MSDEGYRRAELQDRAEENRQLRGDAARALRLLEQGRVEGAKSLLRAISRAASK